MRHLFFSYYGFLVLSNNCSSFYLSNSTHFSITPDYTTATDKPCTHRSTFLQLSVCTMLSPLHFLLPLLLLLPLPPSMAHESSYCSCPEVSVQSGGLTALHRPGVLGRLAVRKLDGVAPFITYPWLTCSTILSFFILIFFSCDIWHVTHYLGHVTCNIWHIVGGDYSLKIPGLFRFGSEGALNILRKRMSQ